MSEITTTVEIADKTGHTTLELTKSETMSRVAASEDPGFSPGTSWFRPSS